MVTPNLWVQREHAQANKQASHPICLLHGPLPPTWRGGGKQEVESAEL